DVHDPAAGVAASALGEHLAHGRPAEYERPAEVDRHDGVEILIRRFQHRLGVTAGQSGIIDNHVELPGRCHGTPDKLVAVLAGRHVRADELAGPAAALDEDV